MHSATVFQTDDGRVALRFVRLLPHAPERVWRAITDPVQLSAWFPAVVDLLQPVGTELYFGVTEAQRRRYGMSDDPERKPNGRILRNEPPSVLEYEWEAGLEVVEAQLDGQPVTWDPLDRAEELARS